MRNRRLGRKLGVTTKHRKAVLRNLATHLFKHEKIRTTDVKAKELKRVAEKIVTFAKNSAKENAPGGGLAFKRRIFGYITDKDVARKVFTEIAQRYNQRPGGYTRIIRLGFRKGDRAPVSLIELVSEQYAPSSRKKTPRKSALPSPPPAEKEQSAGDRQHKVAEPKDKNPEAKSGSEAPPAKKESATSDPAEQSGEK